MNMQSFGKTRLLDQLTEEEKDAFLARFREEHYEMGQAVFMERDSGESLFVVQSGFVSLSKEITADVKKKLFSARPGDIFGEFSFMDARERSATAVAEDETVVLALNRKDYDAFIQEAPGTGVKLYQNLLAIVVERLRQTNEHYRDAVNWGLEITGTRKLNFQYLITENVNICVELTNGRNFEGKVLQLEQSDAGHEVLIVDELGRHALIPYHAIVTVTLAT